MMTTSPINLDKLRNAVQKFGAMSLTTAQVSADYYQNEEEMPEPLFEALLHRHSALLGIHPQAPNADGHTNTIWQAL